VNWKYSYDPEGRLTEAHLDGRLICRCAYDREGRRVQDYFPRRNEHASLNYKYSLKNRLMSAGNNTYTHDKNGFRTIWNSKGR
jgi:YD repeat-containing protein